ncbi:MAG: hypothetical protein M0Z36_09290 [Thermaerobacter sp.]|nr:hypothetical protein [Thermaerobacter sp.]
MYDAEKPHTPEPTGLAPCEGQITLKAGTFPSTLTPGVDRRGIDVFVNTVYASAPVGLKDEASQHWLQSLRDWMAGTLDTTGQQYRVTTCRPSSLPRLPDDTSQAVLRQDVQRLLRKGNQAKFRDFAALKSGRDAYSRLHYQELIARLSEADAILIIASDLPEEDQASACRWVLHGLPVEMALHRVRGDREIRQNAHRTP